MGINRTVAGGFAGVIFLPCKIRVREAELTLREKAAAACRPINARPRGWLICLKSFWLSERQKKRTPTQNGQARASDGRRIQNSSL